MKYRLTDDARDDIIRSVEAEINHDYGDDLTKKRCWFNGVATWIYPCDVELYDVSNNPAVKAVNELSERIANAPNYFKDKHDHD